MDGYMKHKLVAILTSALIVTGILSAVAFAEEGQADEYTKLEGSGSSINQSNTSKYAFIHNASGFGVLCDISGGTARPKLISISDL
jgi:hypothetical protein